MIESHRANRSTPTTRRGVLTICVLVCLTIAATIMVAIAGSALRARRNVQIEHQLVQTDWLLDAGIMHARDRLSQQPDYEGEILKPTGAIEDFGVAEIAIEVTTDASRQRVIDVTATLVESAERARTTRRSQRISIPNIPTDETLNAE